MNFDYYTKEKVFRKTLKALYETAIKINNIQFKDLYEHNNPYLWFNDRNLIKTNKEENNPFYSLYENFSVVDETLIYFIVA
ncbi:MAG: hypothetical protein ACOCUI_02795 [bacterium]